jgi:hypothetical protein
VLWPRRSVEGFLNVRLPGVSGPASGPFNSRLSELAPNASVGSTVRTNLRDLTLLRIALAQPRRIAC